MKTYKTSRIIANKISSIFQKNKISFKDSNELFTGKLAVKKFDADLSSNSFTIVSLTHYEMCLIHQYLRLQSKKSGDFEKKLVNMFMSPCSFCFYWRSNYSSSQKCIFIS